MAKYGVMGGERSEGMAIGVKGWAKGVKGWRNMG